MTMRQVFILALYIIFVVSGLACLIPTISAQIIAGSIFSSMLFFFYVFRFFAEKESLMHSHMDYLIRTIWISTILLMIGFLVAYLLADNSVMEDQFESILNGDLEGINNLNETISDYSDQNKITYTVCFGLSAAYILYRALKGMICVYNGLTMNGLKPEQE